MNVGWKPPQLFNNVIAIVKEETCMKFYDETKTLYLETDASQD